MLKLSIITINYNNAAGLLKTFETVFAQTYTGFEYIVIDGGSTDESKAIINLYNDKINYWVSEKDKGVYHAMNKGIQKANGEYLLFLNSGDCFTGDKILEQAFAFEFNESIVYCDVKNNVTGEKIAFPDQLRFSHFYHATINHQSAFIKKQLFNEYGLYNENYEIASDWEFFIKCIFLKLESSRHLNLALVEFDFTDGISAKLDNFEKMIGERKTILLKYFPGFVKDYEDVEELKQQFYLRNLNSLKVNRYIVRLLRKFKTFSRR